MKPSLLHSVFKEEYLGLHIHLGANGDRYSYVHVTKKKEALTILAQGAYPNFELLKEHLNTKVPVLLTLTGKKIISRKTGVQANYLDSVLFNQDMGDFYIFEQHKSEEIRVSVGRKDGISEIVQDIKEAGFTVLQLTLGPFVLESLIPVAPALDQIHLDDQCYVLKLGDIRASTEEASPKNLTIGETLIKHDNLYAFAGIMAFFQEGLFSSNFEESLASEREEFVFRQRFNVLGGAILTLFLLLLLSSYLLQSHYNQKSANIQAELSVKTQQMELIKSLREDRDFKQSIINSSSLGKKEYLSRYLFDIGQSVPEDILLEGLHLFPLKKKIKPNEKLQIEPNSIVIQGRTNSDVSVDSWVQELDRIGWVKKTELSSYDFKKRDYLFSIRLYF